MVTERLRFITFVLKLPMRHPLLVAKQATSVAVMTDNRLALGVGSSPWPEDYELVDVPWEGRGSGWTRRWPSCVACRPGASSSTTARCTTCPRSRSARRPPNPSPSWWGATPPRPSAGPPGRTAGSTAGGDPADLPGLLERLGHLREEEGTADRPFEVHVISLDAYSVDGIHRLEEQGVTDVIVGFRWPYEVGPDTEELQTKLDNLRRFADDVIGKVRS